MIRDFLQHLIWEIRVSHFEQTAKPDTINPELAEQLALYQEKYGSVMLPVQGIDGEGETPERVGQAAANLREATKRVREEQLQHLDALRSLFAEALKCATWDIRKGGPPNRIWSVKRLLGESDRKTEGGAV
jgi:hypothetical protein